EAEPVLRECLEIREKAQPDEWTTFETRSLLGGSLMGQQKYAAAEPLILAGYEGMRARQVRILAPARTRLGEAAQPGVRLYEGGGRAEPAKAWKKRLGLADLPADVFAGP